MLRELPESHLIVIYFRKNVQTSRRWYNKLGEGDYPVYLSCINCCVMKEIKDERICNLVTVHYIIVLYQTNQKQSRGYSPI
jgi:hypothetical protein